MKHATVKYLAAISLLLCFSSIAAHADYPTLVLKNQFGEQSNNVVIGGTCALPGAAANSIISNITGSTATPIANSYADVSAKLVPTMLITGFTSGAGVVAGTDTVLAALQKVAGNTQNKRLLVFTSAASAGGGATEALTLTGLLGTDTILSVTQKTPGANSLPLLGYSTLAADHLTGIWSGDPGVGAVIVVHVLR